MQIAGKWLRFNDGIYRPVVRGWVLDGTGRLVADEFLVDIGADQTVFSAALLAKLALPESEPSNDVSLFGAGGRAEFVLVQAVVELEALGGAHARVRGEFAAFKGADDLGINLLGRDVLNHFDVIISRRNNEVAMLTGNHRYQIAAVSAG